MIFLRDIIRAYRHNDIRFYDSENGINCYIGLNCVFDFIDTAKDVNELKTTNTTKSLARKIRNNLKVLKKYHKDWYDYCVKRIKIEDVF